MRVNVDLMSANYFGSGICVFENEIVRRLAAMPEFELHGCASYIRAYSSKDYTRFSFPVTYSPFPYKLAYNLSWPFAYETIMGYKPDVNLFCTYCLPNFRFREPVIGTVHDIILQKVNNEPAEVTEKYDAQVRHCIEVSDTIVTVSNATKQDIVEYYGLNPDKIVVVHNGVDCSEYAVKLTEADKARIRKKYGLPEKFILYFGAVRKHKNLERLLRAYAMLPHRIREEYKLVLTRKENALERLAADLEIGQDVVFTGFVDDGDKVALYKMAEVSMFVSLYEGFGIPIIEAQAAGTPVITSNISSMPEAAGEGAILVDPYSVENIAAELEHVIENSTLREQLIEKGYANAQRFSWDAAAKQMAEVVRRYRR